MGEYYEEKPFKINAKRKKDKHGEISDIIKKKQWKCYKKKIEKGTNNDSWIK